MALSKEFLKEWRNNAEIPAPIDAILWGMRKQKQIDIGNAKQAFTKVCGWLEILPSYNEMLNEFVQKLEKAE